MQLKSKPGIYQTIYVNICAHTHTHTCIVNESDNPSSQEMYKLHKAHIYQKTDNMAQIGIYFWRNEWMNYRREHERAPCVTVYQSADTLAHVTA